MNDKTFLSIFGGPSKFGLTVALFDRKGDGGKPRRMKFAVSDGSFFTAVIKSVASDNESGEKWTLKGYTTHIKRSEESELPSGRNLEFEGSYSTDERTGSFKFTFIPR